MTNMPPLYGRGGARNIFGMYCGCLWPLPVGASGNPISAKEDPMPDSPSDGERNCMTIAKVFTLYQMARQDAVITPDEDVAIYTGLQEATIIEETKEAATLFAIQ